MVNSNIFPNNDNKLDRTINNIVTDIKCVLSTSYWNHISHNLHIVYHLYIFYNDKAFSFINIVCYHIFNQFIYNIYII